MRNRNIVASFPGDQGGLPDLVGAEDVPMGIQPGADPDGIILKAMDKGWIPPLDEMALPWSDLSAGERLLRIGRIAGLMGFGNPDVPLPLGMSRPISGAWPREFPWRSLRALKTS